MITDEMIQSNEGLAELTPAQIEIITGMSKTDQESVIENEKTAFESGIVDSLNTAFGSTIKSISEIDKISEAHKASNSTFETQVSTLTKKVSELTLAKSTDEAVKTELATAKELLKSTQTAMTKQAKEHEKSMAKLKSESATELKGMTFTAAMAGLVINPDLPKLATSSTIDAVKAQFEKLETGTYDGKTILKLDGTMILNPAKGNLPYDNAGDWIAAQLAPILTGKKVKGVDQVTKKSHVDDNGKLLYDMTGVSTRTEAVSGYVKQLKSEGKTSQEINKMSRELVASDSYKALPV